MSNQRMYSRFIMTPDRYNTNFLNLMHKKRIFSDYARELTCSLTKNGHVTTPS